MVGEHLYIIVYDISDPKRWRRIFNLMKGYGVWLQLSVFQCRLSQRRQAELIGRIREIVDHGEDHVLCFDLGGSEHPEKTVISIGRPFQPVRKEPVIV